MYGFDWFTLLSLIFSFVVCCAPAMAIDGFVDGLFDEEPPKRGGRKPSPRRGLPDDKSLHELAKTYLERALEYEQQPPDEAWNAVEVFKKK